MATGGVADTSGMSTLDRRQLRTVRETIRLAVPLLGVWGMGLIVMAWVAAQTEQRAGELLMDPAFSLGSRWYTGLISNFGILAWTVAVAAALAGAWLCRLGGRASARHFLQAGAAVGILLLMDDLLQFHAVLLPAELGVPKSLGQALLGASALAWAVRNRLEIRRTHAHLLAASVVALGCSFLIDSIVGPTPGQGWSVVEDGAKFLGVLAWATYFVVTTGDISRSVFSEALMTWPDDAYDAAFGPADDAASGERRPQPVG